MSIAVKCTSIKNVTYRHTDKVIHRGAPLLKTKLVHDLQFKNMFGQSFESRIYFLFEKQIQTCVSIKAL